MNALYRAVLVATLISALISSGDDGLRLDRRLLVRQSLRLGRCRARDHRAPRRNHRVLHRHPLEPGQGDRARVQTGHATNIIEGLAIGMQATALPVVVIAIGILLANHLAGLFGIGVAVMAQLSMTGLIVALDAYGPSPTTQAGSPRWRSPAGGACHH